MCKHCWLFTKDPYVRSHTCNFLYEDAQVLHFAAVPSLHVPQAVLHLYHFEILKK